MANQFNFLSLHYPMATLIFLRTSSSVSWSLYEMFRNLQLHLISKACIIFSSSAVKFHDSQANRNRDMKRGHINFTFDPRDMFLSFSIDFSFVGAAVACAVLETTLRKTPVFSFHLKQLLITVSKFLIKFLILISLWMPLALIVISLVLSALIPFAGFVETFNYGF